MNSKICNFLAFVVNLVESKFCYSQVLLYLVNLWIINDNSNEPKHVVVVCFFSSIITHVLFWLNPSFCYVNSIRRTLSVHFKIVVPICHTIALLWALLQRPLILLSYVISAYRLRTKYFFFHHFRAFCCICSVTSNIIANIWRISPIIISWRDILMYFIDAFRTYLPGNCLEISQTNRFLLDSQTV